MPRQTFDFDGEVGWEVTMRKPTGPRSRKPYPHLATLLKVDGIMLVIPNPRPWDLPETHLPVIGVIA